jgi:hypothetical protein
VVPAVIRHTVNTGAGPAGIARRAGG